MRKFKFNRSQPKRNDSLLPAGQPASDTDITDLSLRVLLICITKALGDFKSSHLSSKTLQISLKNTEKSDF